MTSVRDWDIAENRTLYACWIPWEIGMIGPAGGIIFYDAGYSAYYDDDWRFLEAAPAAAEARLPWGGRGAAIATGTDIGWGFVNTERIVSALGTGTQYAARHCSTNSHNGYRDWFLPSRAELQRMWWSRSIIGDMRDNTSYWSSSQSDAESAWRRNFITGESVTAWKSGEYYARPIRRF